MASLLVTGRPRSGGWIRIGPFFLVEAAFMRSSSELETTGVSSWSFLGVLRVEGRSASCGGNGTSATLCLSSSMETTSTSSSAESTSGSISVPSTSSVSKSSTALRSSNGKLPSSRLPKSSSSSSSRRGPDSRSKYICSMLVHFKRLFISIEYIECQAAATEMLDTSCIEA